MKTLKKICIEFACALACLNSPAFEYANSQRAGLGPQSRENAPKAQTPQGASSLQKPESESYESQLSDLKIRYLKLKSPSEKYALTEMFLNKAKEIPPRIDIGEDVIFVKKTEDKQKFTGRFTIVKKGDFPEIATLPDNSAFLNALPSPYKIVRSCDRNRDGTLQEDEVITLLLDIHMRFDSADSEVRRRLVLSRYGEVLNSLKKEELLLTWGKDSNFRLLRAPKTRLWSAPDEKPLKKYEHGEHPSYKLTESLAKMSGQAKHKLLRELRKCNPCDRPKLIEKSPAKCGSSPRANAGGFDEQTLPADDGLDSFAEIINENGESAIVPIFLSDPKNTPEILAEYTRNNAAILSD